LAIVNARVDASLLPWPEISEHDWGGLLVGNGASMAVWSKFGYRSLYEEAQRDDLEHSLQAADVALFDGMETTNFESVLSALQTARVVANALGTSRSEIDERHEAIRLALIAAVREVHVPWNEVSEEVLVDAREALLQFSWVFSTNYDLLLYWAIMQEDPYPFPDYFWSQPFSVTDTEVARKATRMLFLHGGLHLHRDLSGRTFKRIAGAENLLDSFGEGADEGFTPLFVAEGSADEKVQAIRQSDYLTFAYKTFAERRVDFVVFGSSLGETDRHLLQAMRQWGGRTIAIGLRPGSAEAVIIERKARLCRELPDAALTFFDASTFPLGRRASN
jgi:hypothetical protein